MQLAGNWHPRRCCRLKDVSIKAILIACTLLPIASAQAQSVNWDVSVVKNQTQSVKPLRLARAAALDLTIQNVGTQGLLAVVLGPVHAPQTYEWLDFLDAPGQLAPGETFDIHLITQPTDAGDIQIRAAVLADGTVEGAGPDTRIPFAYWLGESMVYRHVRGFSSDDVGALAQYTRAVPRRTEQYAGDARVEWATQAAISGRSSFEGGIHDAIEALTGALQKVQESDSRFESLITGRVQRSYDHLKC